MPSVDFVSNREVHPRPSLRHVFVRDNDNKKERPREVRIHTYSHDTKRPYIHFRAIFLTYDNLRCHPIRSTYHSRSLCMRGIRDRRAGAKVDLIGDIKHELKIASRECHCDYILILMSPVRLSNTWLLLMSRCMMPCLCKYCRPCVISLLTAAI